MITSKNGYVGTRKCVKYSGTHEELRDMLKKGDIVTLLWQNDDKSESIKITGTVIEYNNDIACVLFGGEEHYYALSTRGIIAPYIYTITSIKRPIANIMPDAPGPWSDRNGDTWIVSDDLDAIRVSDKETWLLGGYARHPYEYAEYAPFKKIDINKDEA